MDPMEQPEPEVAGHYYALQVSVRGRISSGGGMVGFGGFGWGFRRLTSDGGFSFPVGQVGSYFLTGYYNVLTNQPHLASQFYTDSSSVVRLDCETGQWSLGETMEVQSRSLVIVLHFSSLAMLDFPRL